MTRNMMHPLRIHHVPQSERNNARPGSTSRGDYRSPGSDQHPSRERDDTPGIGQELGTRSDNAPLHCGWDGSPNHGSRPPQYHVPQGGVAPEVTCVAVHRVSRCIHLEDAIASRRVGGIPPSEGGWQSNHRLLQPSHPPGDKLFVTIDGPRRDEAATQQGHGCRHAIEHLPDGVARCAVYHAHHGVAGRTFTPTACRCC